MRGLFSGIHSRLAKDQRPVEHQQPNQTTHETTSSHLYNVGRFFPDLGIGLCLCRFSYTPLTPSMIDADWVTRPEAGFLGGFNFLGYLLGCLAALFFVQKLGVK